ncbi:hypothetical protein [Streptomyces sp. NPDC058249]|uniref:hypothetical protein n=1 Tax=Streptomyces sp. NPDC058249 TaxID=3346403 RepID=UPI0036EA22B9
MVTVRGSEINPATLTPAQLDGIACVVCGDEERPMRPVGAVDGCQVFACPPCVDGPTADVAPVVLVVGDASTPVALEDLTAFAFDVADRLGVPARVAVGRAYDVTDYAGVALADNWLDDVSSVVLGIEAQGADMFVIDADTLYAYAVDETCGHCGDEGGAAPVLVGDTWSTSVHASCVSAHARAKALSLTA